MLSGSCSINLALERTSASGIQNADLDAELNYENQLHVFRVSDGLHFTAKATLFLVEGN